MDNREHYLNLLWQERIHVEPDALSGLTQSQPPVETVWELARRFLVQLRPFPSGMIRWWLEQPGGHLVIRMQHSLYQPGQVLWRGSRLNCIAFISADEAAGVPGSLPEALIALLDHLWGSGASENGGIFSSGQGATAALQQAAQRYQRIARLGYGLYETKAADSAEYLVKTMQLALRSMPALNILDPLLSKLYTQTLLSDSFWQRQHMPSH